MRLAVCQKEKLSIEEHKTGIGRIRGVLDPTKENLKVYVLGDSSSKIEVVIFRGLHVL